MDENVKKTLDELRSDIHLKSIVYRNKCKQKKAKRDREKDQIVVKK